MQCFCTLQPPLTWPAGAGAPPRLPERVPRQRQPALPPRAPAAPAPPAAAARWPHAGVPAGWGQPGHRQVKSWLLAGAWMKGSGQLWERLWAGAGASLLLAGWCDCPPRGPLAAGGASAGALQQWLVDRRRLPTSAGEFSGCHCCRCEEGALLPSHQSSGGRPLQLGEPPPSTAVNNVCNAQPDIDSCCRDTTTQLNCLACALAELALRTPASATHAA